MYISSDSYASRHITGICSIPHGKVFLCTCTLDASILVVITVLTSCDKINDFLIVQLQLLLAGTDDNTVIITPIDSHNNRSMKIQNALEV